MAHVIGLRAKNPSAAQAAQIRKGLKAFTGDYLSLVTDKQNGKPAMWVECQDDYGASHMAEKAQAVRSLLDRVMG